MSQANRPQKKVFVVMPFSVANERKAEDLTYFYENHIKGPIEANHSLLCQYLVKRSEAEFSITDGIISDLVSADVVVCDLSGSRSNPNVMYELGIRLSVSNRPVILIRESASENEQIFDIHGLYQHAYSQSRIKKLEEHLISKLTSFENDPAGFVSPILKSINSTSTYWSEVPRNKASAFLGGLALATEAALRIFGSQVQSFLLDQGKPVTPLPPDQVYKILQQVTDPAALANFKYSFARLPALDNYLSSIYLMGLIEPGIEKLFREFLIAYSINFLATTSPYVQADHTLLLTAYSAESLILINLCRTLIKLLQSRAGSAEERLAMDSFQANAQKSNILKAING